MLEDDFKCLACGNVLERLAVASDREQIRCACCGCETQKIVSEAEFGCEVDEGKEF